MLTESRSSERRSRLIRTAAAALVLVLLPGCGTLYLLQAAHGEAQVLHRRRPIAKVIRNPKTPPPLRVELEQVRAARRFASEVLGLPRNRSYRTYSDVGRPYVVWNVVAAPEFSIVPKHWCYPIVGCVAYRGYFSERAARRFAARLAARGYDVYLGGVPAYSTLGRFADPVLSTMIPYGSVELASIIFHELAHQLLYVRGDSRFDEAFATTVEHEGVRRWLLYRGKLAALARYEQENALELQYVRLFRRARTALAALYASGVPKRVMLARKRARLAALAAAMRKLGREFPGKGPPPYEDWLESGINNADLASVATYYDCVPGFERLLADDEGDLQRFYSEVRALAREPQRKRDAAVCLSAQRSVELRNRSNRAGTASVPK
ncbi:MAG: aminopeptidase [Steroidobacteraceae bacterium]